MILILSKAYDTSTNEVIKWLNCYGADWVRINGEDIDESRSTLKLNISEHPKQVVTIGGKRIDLASVNVVWFRRQHDFQSLKKNVFAWPHLSAVSQHSVYRYLQQEINTIFYGVARLLDCAWLDKPVHTNINKIQVLTIAQQVGLSIPPSLLTNSKAEIKAFLRIHGRLITKPIFEVQIFEIAGSIFMPYTCLVDEETVDELNTTIFPSLVQAYIPKTYEVRIFYLNGVLYPMAIFSQNDQTTKIDFRQYNFTKPNRNVPVGLPPEVVHKIRMLMDALDLHHGSIDMIKAPNGTYYFLEVNPVGQFGMVSDPCNYGLEEAVAKYLIAKNEERAQKTTGESTPCRHPKRPATTTEFQANPSNNIRNQLRP